jgi:hypothetical protein
MTSSIKFVVYHKSTPVDIGDLFRIIYVCAAVTEHVAASAYLIPTTRQIEKQIYTRGAIVSEIFHYTYSCLISFLLVKLTQDKSF